MSSGLMQTAQETLGRNGRTSKPRKLQHVHFKSRGRRRQTRAKQEMGTEMEEDGWREISEHNTQSGRDTGEDLGGVCLATAGEGAPGAC